ncbi:DsrE family protein [bacterium]|nr:DsrE family protein [bacterium]
MRLLVIINYRADNGTDIAWNAVRTANKAWEMGMDVRVFLMNDGVWNAHRSFGVAENETQNETHRILAQMLESGTTVRACGTCMDRAGIDKDEILDGVIVSALTDFVNWITDCERIVTF